MNVICNNKNTKCKLGWSLVVCVLVVGLVCGGWWLFRDESVGIADTDEPTSEQIERFLSDYAEVMSENDADNVLIVMNEEKPEAYGALDVIEAPNHTYYLVYDSAEARDTAYAKLEQDDLISVERNVKMQLLAYNSWGISRIGLDDALTKVGYGNNNIEVAVIDTGLNVDLFRRSFPDIQLSTYDIETNSAEISNMVDYDGHGTHIAGTIAEGTPGNTSLFAIRAAKGKKSEINSTDVTTAIYEAISHGAKVINISLGAYSWLPSQKAALDYAKEHDVVTVAAAGNDGGSETLYPAGYDNTLSVSAVNSDLSFASYSNYGDTIDFSAPGTGIQSINGVMSGTSMATPHVVDAVAVLKTYNPQVSFEDTKDLLIQHVQDLGDEGWDQRFGYGMIDFSNAEFCHIDEYCDEFGVFAVDAPSYTKMEIGEIKLTGVNYYSISNLMLTELNLYTDETNYVTKKVQDIQDCTITGYNAEYYGTQEVTFNCEGVSATGYVANPNNYLPGWEYRIENDQIYLTRYYDLQEFDYDNESVKKLYIPERINGKNVVELSVTEEEYHYGEGEDEYYMVTHSVFDRSSYSGQNIREVYLPEAIKVIGDSTFQNFSVLEKVSMGENVRVGDYAFHNTRRLKKVDGSVIELGAWAFIGDESLEAITLAEGLTTMGYNAFDGCYSLKEIVLPSTLTEVGFGAFEDDRSLERVVFLGDNVLRIDTNAFAGTSSLKNITLPESLEVINANAFYGSSLTSIRIPANVTRVSEGAFGNNKDLATIVVDDANQHLYDVDDKALMQDMYGDVNLIAGTKSMFIPDTTTRIGSGAFEGFETEGVLIIPDSVEVIGPGAFFGCTGLTEVVIPKDAAVASEAFERRKESEYSYETVPLDLTLYVYSHSPANDYAVQKGFNYYTLDASYARVINSFDGGDVLTGDVEMEFYYDYGTRNDDVFTNYAGFDGTKVIKTVGQLDGVEYAGEVEYFRIGDTYFNALYKDILGKNVKTMVEVTINGELPDYTVPTGLTAKLRKWLSSVELPEGFSWMDDNVYLDELGEHTFLARYVPSDGGVYAPIENIEIVVTTVVGRTILNDLEIVLRSKVYDGSWDIDDSYITINGLDGLERGRDYRILYACTDSVEVGVTSATVGIELSDEISDLYGFGEEAVPYYWATIEGYEILPAEPEFTVDDRTNGLAEVVTLSDGVKLTAEQACTVIVTYDGGLTYERVSAVAVEGEENTYKFEFVVNNDVEVLVVLRGDGDMDGEVSTSDSNLINRSLISETLRPYRALSALEAAIFDVDGDGDISTGDSNLINRSLISSSLLPYRTIAW